MQHQTTAVLWIWHVVIASTVLAWSVVPSNAASAFDGFAANCVEAMENNAGFVETASLKPLSGGEAPPPLDEPQFLAEFSYFQIEPKGTILAVTVQDSIIAPGCLVLVEVDGRILVRDFDEWAKEMIESGKFTFGPEDVQGVPIKNYLWMPARRELVVSSFLHPDGEVAFLGVGPCGGLIEC